MSKKQTQLENDSEKLEQYLDLFAKMEELEKKLSDLKKQIHEVSNKKQIHEVLEKINLIKSN
ncbi:MAG: hypothetical protein WC414_01030 [Patescibacteria group bacterium]